MDEKLTYEALRLSLKKSLTKIASEFVAVDVLAAKIKLVSELIIFCQTKLQSTEQEVNNIIKQMETKTSPNSQTVLCYKK